MNDKVVLMSIVFVHGTGVRLENYVSGFEKAKQVASAAGLHQEFIECAWGDPLGIQFKGYSLPDVPTPDQLEKEADDFARWSWLFDDPLFELQQLTIRDTDAAPPVLRPGVKPGWLKLWDQIVAYQPTEELKLLLARGGLGEYWDGAWAKIVKVSPIPKEAFEASAHELAEASHALARAVIAQLYVAAVAAHAPGPSRVLRKSLFDRLIVDWKQEVYGLGTFFAKIFKRLSTDSLRKHRNRFTDLISLPVGDVLLYQSRGEEVRQFIRKKIEAAPPPVTVVAHSLGGIACVDLLASPKPPTLSRLVTAGSQSPLLFEIGALYSMKPPAGKLPPYSLPAGFPPWLNLYDRNDFLSYVAGRLWPEAKDFEVESGQPFPDSHSAYFGNEAAWRAIKEFIGP